MAEENEMIKFGAFPQESPDVKLPITWRVLKKDAGRMLLLSEKAIDCRQYHNSYHNVTWETCELRQWLNGEFLNTAFTEEEQKRILTAAVSADKNPLYGTDPGRETLDRIFLLSAKEVTEYFSGDKDRICAPTKFAVGRGAWTSDSDKTEEGEASCYFWLRTPGAFSYGVSYINSGGLLYLYGDDALLPSGCVRPALWIGGVS